MKYSLCTNVYGETEIYTNNMNKRCFSLSLSLLYPLPPSLLVQLFIYFFYQPITYPNDNSIFFYNNNKKKKNKITNASAFDKWCRTISHNLLELAVANYNMLRCSEITVWREPGYKVPEDITEKGKQSFDEPRG